jgi:hypothetical protein
LCALRFKTPAGTRSKVEKPESPESSAALAFNTFGWFLTKPSELPPFPQLADIAWQPRSGRSSVRCALHGEEVGIPGWMLRSERNTTSSGSHPSAMSRFAPANLQTCLTPTTVMFWARTSYRQLDAVQLVKHAFGLVTQGRRIGKAPALFYLYAEPWQHGSSLVTDSALALHRQEFASFTRRVVGGEVRFAACSYREYLAGWAGDVRAHAPAILARFKP